MEFEEIVGVKPVNDKIFDVILETLIADVKGTSYSAEKNKELQSKVKALNYEKENLAFANSDIYHFERDKDYDKLADAILKLTTMDHINGETLNNLAWSIYENSDKTDVLQKAAQIAHKSLLQLDKPTTMIPMRLSC